MNKTFTFGSVTAYADADNITINRKTKTIQEWQQRYREVAGWMKGFETDEMRATMSWVLWKVGPQDKKTLAECRAAVKRDWRLIQFIENPSPLVSAAALRKHGKALEYIKPEDQNPRLCKLAVEQCGLALVHVHVQTRGISVAAVKQNGSALQHVTNQCTTVSKAAIRQKWQAFRHVKKQTTYLCRYVLLREGLALQFIKKQTPMLCALAVKQNPLACKMIKCKILRAKIKEEAGL